MNTAALFDLVPMQGGHRRESPKADPGCSFRPQKTILVRTVADGGESFLPALWRLLTEKP